ncbi:ABC transporter ATP-binding protein [Metabacillus sp. KIGAM252]|uniref:ABC transporter ATP-binding protein n=1 Tax=Metabacillus flavus TaxID=2823519 RepID=A0ABS5LGD6_9BACI|nr:ABC transporter ATP-binding protein [Metabacillus flavus]MBS2969638.1 ABC transporter ATP-binding protein [Metabacillus flavus]
MSIIRLYIKDLFKFSGWLLPLNLFGMVIASLLEGIGILMLIPMISVSGVITGKESNFFAPYLGFVDIFPEGSELFFLLCLFILIMIAQSLLQRGIAILNVKLLHEFSRDLRIKLFRETLRSDWSFFIRKRKSDLINSLTSELARVISGINLVLQLITSIVFTLIQVILAFWLSASITGFVLLCGAVMILFSKKFINRARKVGNKTSLFGQEYLAGMSDQFNGIKDIKSNTLENSQLSWFSSLTHKMVGEQIEYVKLQSNSELYYKITSSVFIAIIIYFSITAFQAQFEQLLAIILIFSRLWPRFTGIQSTIQNIASTIPAFESVHHLYKECLSSSELRDYQDDGIEPYKLKSSIVSNNICFKYKNSGSNDVLKSINAKIRANQMTAIVGSSGAGKSTFIDILMGLMKPDHGELLIDGGPLNDERLTAWRKSISYVPQDSFLFNASIRENLTMVHPNAKEPDLWQALKFSSAAEFVRKLPEGLDTHIGDRGVRLSGGERQRLVLARAILRNPSILVLDEATSALDSENERKIQEALEGLKGKMTIIVIAHRLSTIRNADQVIVLEEGRIVQAGGFHELASQKSGQFGRLLGNQLEAIQ